MSLLEVHDLRVRFRTDDGPVQAVSGVSLCVERGETLGIVGESGSGKSVMNLALLGLLPRPPAEIEAGAALFQGRDLLTMNGRDLSRVRGNRIAMIFQDPMTALNPFLTIEEQLTEVTRHHLGHSRRQALDHAIAMLRRVGIPGAERRIFDYPHTFSGGMRQRVVIAMALLCKPDLVIADEPTTALDVTIQAQILDLLKELQREEGMAMILITHDLGVVAGACHRVNVMYAGRFVEEAPVEQLFADPRHPYTFGLMESLPRLDSDRTARLTPIVGSPPDLVRLPSGCAFHPRCPFAVADCRANLPPITTLDDGRRHACLVDVRSAPRAEVCDV